MGIDKTRRDNFATRIDFSIGVVGDRADGDNFIGFDPQVGDVASRFNLPGAVPPLCRLLKQSPR